MCLRQVQQALPPLPALDPARKSRRRFDRAERRTGLRFGHSVFFFVFFFLFFARGLCSKILLGRVACLRHGFGRCFWRCDRGGGRCALCVCRYICLRFRFNGHRLRCFRRRALKLDNFGRFVLSRRIKCAFGHVHGHWCCGNRWRCLRIIGGYCRVPVQGLREASDIFNALFTQEFLHTANGHAIFVQEFFYPAQKRHIPRAIIASPARAFDRFHLGKAALPKAQNMRGRVEPICDLADRAKSVGRFVHLKQCLKICCRQQRGLSSNEMGGR